MSHGRASLLQVNLRLKLALQVLTIPQFSLRLLHHSPDLKILDANSDAKFLVVSRSTQVSPRVSTTKPSHKVNNVDLSRLPRRLKLILAAIVQSPNHDPETHAAERLFNW